MSLPDEILFRLSGRFDMIGFVDNIHFKERKMFRKNTSHLQPSLFGIASQLPKTKLKKLMKSREHDFYKLVFSKIKEDDFAVLFDQGYSRPNASVNSLVSSIILLNHNGWTTQQLFDRIDFDILTRTALGLDTLEDSPFCPATFFNFQNRLLSHFVETGENLLERVFDHLTGEQLKTLGVKTDIQRSDSFMAMSNIRSYGRTQLLVEMLIRLQRVLSDEDKGKFAGILSPYTKQTSGQYIYNLERGRIPHELEKLGCVYHTLYQELESGYRDVGIFQIFERVYHEHFTVIKDKVQIKPSEELNGSMLQSPDDIDATYRKKNGRHFQGQSVNVTETASDENDVNLITDIAVCPNITDDSAILNDRLKQIKEKTPDLNELHTDGAYGSERNDKDMEKLKITHVQTAVRGRKAEVTIEIEEVAEDEYIVSCPHQSVSSEKTTKRYKACFDLAICKQCSLAGRCCAKEQRKGRVYYFDRADYLQGKRNRNIKLLPPERRKLRPNVEATVKEFTKPFNHKGKLKIRGKFKTMLYAFSMGIAINFGRVWRYQGENPGISMLLRRIYFFLLGLCGSRTRFKGAKEILRHQTRFFTCSQQDFKQAA
jgi:Transposase DDE domain/Transposase domain (DUF772)